MQANAQAHACTQARAHACELGARRKHRCVRTLVAYANFIRRPSEVGAATNALLPRHTTRITPRCDRTGDGRRSGAAPLLFAVQANAAHAGRAEHYYRLAIKVGRATRGHCSTSLLTHAHTPTHTTRALVHAPTCARVTQSALHNRADGAPLTQAAARHFCAVATVCA
jgi:hypothetical protein